MLTLDTEKIARQKHQDEVQLKNELTEAAAANHLQAKARSLVPDGDLQVTLLAQQLGQPIASVELERRLRLMNPRLIFEVSIRYPDRMGIYIEEPVHDLAIDAKQKRIIVAYYIGVLPERDVRHAKKVKVPHPITRGQMIEVDEVTGTTRGWRTILLRLLQEKLITRYHVDKYFPANEHSKNWHALVN